MRKDHEDIEVLIERSSLGTAGARALRDRTPPEITREIRRQASIIDTTAHDAQSSPPKKARGTTTGDSKWVVELIATAAASVNDSDSRRSGPAQTEQMLARLRPSNRYPVKLEGVQLDEAVRAAGQGDRAALTSVLESVRGPVLRYCQGRIGVGERHLFTAEDVAQEALMAVMTALPRYQDRGRPFMAFVYGVAAHKVADAMRVAGRVEYEPVAATPDKVSATDGPEQMALNSDTMRRMRDLLDILPEKQKEVLILRLVVGLSAEETAAAVGATPGAVRVAQHRALAKLKKEVANAAQQSPTDSD